MQAPPEPMQLPLDEYMRNTTWNRAVATAQLWPVTLTNQNGGQDRLAPGQADATLETTRAKK
jgi:hypothetical protein